MRNKTGNLGASGGVETEDNCFESTTAFGVGKNCDVPAEEVLKSPLFAVKVELSVMGDIMVIRFSCSSCFSSMEDVDGCLDENKCVDVLFV